MYTKQPKKLLIINILEILRRHSDADHRLTQRMIMDILKSEYNMIADRKAVKRNLMNLIDFGYNIDYSEIVRHNKDGEEELIYTDWYLKRDFTDAELRLIIDSLLFSKHIPHVYRKEMIEKIERLSSKYFKSKVRHVYCIPTNQPQNRELFYTIEILDEAIENNRKVVFHYSDFGTDKKLHLRCNKEGGVQEYLVNPVQMVAANGRYYLIGNIDKYDDIAHFRLDRIRSISITDDPAKPQKKINGLENGLDLPKHMAEHIYMFSGESQRVTLRTYPWMAGELIDWFGDGVTFTNESEDYVTAHVKVNLQAMRFWALQYAPHVKILSPQSLVDNVKADLKTALEIYEED